MLFNLKTQMNLKYQIHMFLTFLDYQELTTFVLILFQACELAFFFTSKMNDVETACQNRGDTVLSSPK